MAKRITRAGLMPPVDTISAAHTQLLMLLIFVFLNPEHFNINVQKLVWSLDTLNNQQTLHAPQQHIFTAISSILARTEFL